MHGRRRPAAGRPLGREAAMLRRRLRATTRSASRRVQMEATRQAWLSWMRSLSRCAVLPALWLAATTALPDASTQEKRSVTTAEGLRAKVDRSLQDAAQRTQLDAAQLSVALAEAVTWPDGSLGCPQPGRAYTQALVRGYRIQIVAGDRTLEYHASLRGTPFLCPVERIQPPTACSPQPPFATCMFFGLAPPNSTMSRVWRAIDDHDVSGPLTACAEPSTCGRKVSAAPKL